MELLVNCIKNKDTQIKQFVYSILGDTAKNCPQIFNQETVSGLIGVMVPDLILMPKEMDPGYTYLSLCNNAIYGLIEFLGSYHAAFEPYIVPIIEKLGNIITNTKINKSLLLNWAIFFGTICLYFPDRVGACLNGFLKPFGVAFCKSTVEDEQKGHSFTGIILACSVNSQS